MRLDRGPSLRDSILFFLFALRCFPARALCENVEAPPGPLRDFHGPRRFHLRTESVLKISSPRLGASVKGARGS